MECNYSSQGCSNDVIAYCPSCIPKPNLCLNHAKEHMNNQNHIPSQYSPQYIYKHNLSKIRSKIKEIKSQIILEASSIARKVNKIMKKSLRKIDALNKNIKTVSDFSEFTINKDCSEKAKENIKYLFAIKNFKSLLFDIKKDTNTLFCFDTETQTYTSKFIENIGPQGLCPAISHISKDYIFLYGGSTSNAKLSTTYFVDFKTGTSRALPGGLARFDAACEHVGNKIYVFGGKNGGIMSESNYFDISEERWVSVQSLHSNVCFTSTVGISNSILISGYPNYLCKYSIEEDSYELVSSGLYVPQNNILIPFNKKVFLVTSGGAYVAELRDLNNWTSVDASFCHYFCWATSSKPVIHGKKAYFVTSSDNKVLSFDCSTYVVSNVALMK